MPGLHAPGYIAGFVRQGLSANEGLRQFRAVGGAIGRTAWLRLYAEQRTATGRRLDEMTAPLQSTPAAHEILPMSTKSKTGFLQTVDVFLRTRGSDVIRTQAFMVSSQSLLARGDAVTTALQQMGNAISEGRYEEVILGAVYTGTRQLTPGDRT